MNKSEKEIEKYKELVIAASKNVFSKFKYIPLTWEDINIYGLSIVLEVAEIAKKYNQEDKKGVIYAILFNKLMTYAKSFTKNNSKIMNFSISFEDEILTKLESENSKEYLFKEDCQRFFKKFSHEELNILNLYYLNKKTVKEISNQFYTSSFKIKRFLEKVKLEAVEYFK
ncbi:hypothetical protein [Mycoplasma sp. 1012]